MSKSAIKKYEAMQERLAKKIYKTKINPLTAGWIFEKWYEKIILIVLMGLGVWKLGGFFV